MGNAASACFGATDRHVTSTDRALLDLKILQRQLRKRADALERSVSAERQAYRELAGQPKAMNERNTHRQRLLLRHIGALQKALDECHVYSYRVDQMLLDIGEASTLSSVQSTLQEATRAMERMTRLMRVEDVEAMQAKLGAARERHGEVKAAMGVTEAGTACAGGREGFEVDEAELEALKAELEESSSISWAVDAPKVPSNRPSEKQEKLAAL